MHKTILILETPNKEDDLARDEKQNQILTSLNKNYDGSYYFLTEYAALYCLDHLIANKQNIPKKALLNYVVSNISSNTDNPFDEISYICKKLNYQTLIDNLEPWLENIEIIHVKPKEQSYIKAFIQAQTYIILELKQLSSMPHKETEETIDLLSPKTDSMSAQETQKIKETTCSYLKENIEKCFTDSRFAEKVLRQMRSLDISPEELYELCSNDSHSFNVLLKRANILDKIYSMFRLLL